MKNNYESMTHTLIQLILYILTPYYFHNIILGNKNLQYHFLKDYPVHDTVYSLVI